MPDPRTEVLISDMAQANLKRLLAQRDNIENQIKIYIQAMRDSLSLEGDDWVMQLDKMVFAQNGVHDVVGTATGDSEREQGDPEN
jgi:hypothetical protein